ncbi:MAG: hypothetical protein M3R15_11015, partial [Acidobacteriota bacterium]|nr:hypothetical protein [Acidobacteriota bacterium]
LLGLFSSYGEIGQKNYTPWRATAFEFFLQDNWKATQKLTLEYGVRYNYWPPWYSLWNNVATFRLEFYQPGLLGINPTNGAVVINSGNFALARYNGISLPGSSFPEEARGRVAAADDASLNDLFRGIPRGLSETHKNVFEPRLGLAYAFNNKTVVRTGFGIFHQRVPLNGSTLYGGNAPLQFLVGVENGSVEAPAGVISSFDDSIRFPFNLTMQDPEFKHPTAYNWSLTVQRQLPGAITVELGYVGKRSLFLTRERNINQLQLGQAFTRNAAGAPTGTVRFANALRPYLGHGPIRLSENAGNSHYHSGQLSVNRRFANGISFDVAYTFSKSIDNASVFRELLPNAYDDRNFRGPSNFDRPHVFVVNGNLELPFGTGRRLLNDGVLSTVFGGFQVTAITFVRSGTPFSLSLPANVDLLGVGGGSSAQSLSARGPLRQIAPRFGGTFVDDPSLITVPAPGTEGNLGRNRFRNPRFQNHDIALFRNFRITESSRIQFRAELFNWINHPVLNGPVANPVANGLTTNLTSTGYGQFAPLTDQNRASGFTVPTRDFGVYNTKGDQRRTIQFALKFLF